MEADKKEIVVTVPPEHGIDWPGRVLVEFGHGNHYCEPIFAIPPQSIVFSPIPGMNTEARKRQVLDLLGEDIKIEIRDVK